VVRPRSCRVIYYFDTPTLGKRHQSFGRVNRAQSFIVVCGPFFLEVPMESLLVEQRVLSRQTGITAEKGHNCLSDWWIALKVW